MPMESTAEICRRLDEEEAAKRQANAHLSVRWSIQKKRQIKGRKNWTLKRDQGDLRDTWDISFSWHSTATEDPLRREYSDQKWACNCSRDGLDGKCAHIPIAQELIREEKKRGRA